ncbi:hypothetical protein FS837_003860, partial [Tulasnella sp. UAMH 9824]
MVNVLWVAASSLNPLTNFNPQPDSTHVAFGATIGGGHPRLKRKAVAIRRDQMIQKLTNDGVDEDAVSELIDQEEDYFGRCAEVAPFLRSEVSFSMSAVSSYVPHLFSVFNGGSTEGQGGSRRVYGLSISTKFLDLPEIQALRPFDSVEKIQAFQRIALSMA